MGITGRRPGYGMGQSPMLCSCDAEKASLSIERPVEVQQGAAKLRPEMVKGMEDWVFDAIVGRTITLIVKMDANNANGKRNTCRLSKHPSILYLDSALEVITIQPIKPSDFPTVSIIIDSIKAISPTTVLVPSLIHQREVRVVSASLEKAEKSRAIVVQYFSDQEYRFVFFLEASEHAKDRFIQELIGIKIEKQQKRCGGDR